MNVEDAHAFLSPSSSERWLTCTESPRFEMQFPDTSSAEADEGTRAHDVVDRLFRGEVVTPDLDHPLEMVEHAIEFVEYVHRLVDELGATLLHETRVVLDPWVPGQFGRGDVILICDRHLIVIDFKYGKGKWVNPIENSQMRLYGLGAYGMLRHIYEFETITTQVWQPRMNNFGEERLTIDELLHWIGTKEVAIRQALHGPGVFRPSEEACQFCRGRAACKARSEYQLQVAGFRNEAPNRLTPDDLATILKRIPDLRRWLNDVEEYALSQAISGNPVPGYKIVEGKSNRVITDPDNLLAQLRERGFADDRILKPATLHGITELQRVVGKKAFEALAGPYLTKPPGKPALAPIDDPRPEYSEAAHVFKDET